MSMSTRCVALLLATLSLVAGAAPAASARGAESGAVAAPAPPAVAPDDTVPSDVVDAGESALAEARAAKQAAYALEAGEARTAALRDAGERYARVAGTEGFAPEVRVEAAFRAGELLRTHGDGGAAREQFAACVRLGEPRDEPVLREFAARALIEQGHLQRRGKEYEAAAQTYGQAVARFAELGKRAAQARGWQLRMLLELEQLDAAEGVAAALLRHVDDDPMETVEGVDRLGVALVEAGRAQAARDLVAALRERLAPHLDGEEPVAERLQLALQELRVTVRLSAS